MGKVASNTGTGAKGFGSRDYIKITIFGLALSALWSSLHTIIIPMRLLDFVAESEKASYLSIIIGVGLLLAIIVQPIAGAISDRSGLSWGRRRPYILVGTILAILFLPGIGFSDSYVTLLVIYCLLQVSGNTAQGPYQALIPDLVPGGKRGLASGVKSLLEMVGGLAVVGLIAYLMDRYFIEQGGPWLGYAIATLVVILLGTMVATVVMVKERPRGSSSQLPLLPTLYKSFKIDVKASPDFVWFLVSRLLIFAAFAALQKFALFFLMDVVGVTRPAAATFNFLIVVGIGMLAAAYFAGRLSDRVGRRPIVLSSGLLGALGIALLFFFHSYSAIMFAAGVIGIASGAFMSTNWALATDLVAKGEEARYLGLTNLATAGGSALTLFIIGPLIDFFNARSPGQGYQAMFLVSFVFLVAGSLLVLKIKGQGLPEEV